MKHIWMILVAIVLIGSAYFFVHKNTRGCALTIKNTTDNALLITHFELTPSQEKNENSGWFTTPGTSFGPGHLIPAQQERAIDLEVNKWFYVYEQKLIHQHATYSMKKWVFLRACPKTQNERVLTTSQMFDEEQVPDFISFENLEAWSAADTILN